MLLCISCESRAEVDEQVRKAVAAGGRAYKEPKDYDFMYFHGYQGLDGHCWELMYMDPSAEKGAEGTVALKVLLHGAYSTERQLHRFEREIDLAARIEFTSLQPPGLANSSPA